MIEIAEAAVMISAFIAAARRLFPRLDGWWVVGSVALISLGLSLLNLWPDWLEGLKTAGLLFVATYGGFNGLRKIAEQVGKGKTPSLPEVKREE